MNRIGIFFLGSLFLVLAILACGEQSAIQSSEMGQSGEENFTNIRPDMFEIHDTTITYYQAAVKNIFETYHAKNRSEFNLNWSGFEIAGSIEDQTITFTSSSHEDHSYLLFSGKGVLKPETINLYYEVSTPTKNQPI